MTAGDPGTLRVIDASVLCDFLLGRPAARAAFADGAERGHRVMHAPELIELEALHVLRRLVRRGHLAVHRADAAVRLLGDLSIFRHSHVGLRSRIWELRENLTAHDASYLALAEATGGTLLTADTGLAAHARQALGDARVLVVA